MLGALGVMAQHNLGFTSSTSDIPLGLQASDRTPAQGGASPGDAKTEALKWPRDAEADDYDPHEHQEVAHPTTNMDTLFHLLKGCFGTGILAMPEAFKFAGYITGTIGTIIVGFVATFSVHLLIEAEYVLSKRRRVPTLSYPEAGRAALEDGPVKTRCLARPMKITIDAFVLGNQLGCCTSYIIFVASNIQAIVERYLPHLALRWYMFIVTIPLILLSWVRDLKYLAPFSTVAMSVTLGCFAVILYYVFKTIPSIDDKVAFGTIASFPLFFGTAMFSLEAMGVMIPLKNEMRNPKAFGGPFGVLNRAMFPIVVLFVCVGLFGYLQYGEDVNATVTINLPQDEYLAQAVRLGMAIAILISHGLMNYVNFDTIWNKGLKLRCEAQKMDGRRQFVYEYLVRTAIVVFQFTAGAIYPNLGIIISLVGALCLSMIGLTFPAVIHLCAFWNAGLSRRRFAWIAFQDGLIAVIGVAALVIGTSTSIDAMVKDFGSVS